MNLTGSLESAMLTRRNPRRPARSRRAAMLIAALALFGVVVPASAAQPNTSRTESSAPLSAQPKTESPAPLGAVVAIGGALRYDNHAVWSRLVALAGGRGARFVVLATASADPDRSAARSVAALEAHGAKAEHLRVAPKLAGIDLATAVQDPQLIARVHAARGVYFTGGAQERIVDTLQPGGRATPLLAAIRDVLDRGGVIAGTSAGAAVLSEVMFRDATDVLAVLKGSLRRGQEVDRGLGLAPSGLFVDQHFLRRGRLGRMLPLMQAQGLELGLGVEENSAAVLRGTELEVIGDGGVLFVDLTAARSDPAGGAFNLSGGRLSHLRDGDRLDLCSRAVTPSAVKAQGTRIDPRAADFKPEIEEPTPFLLDVLADGAVVRGMTHVLDGPAPQVQGLAFDARPDAAAPRDLGFEFRFSRDVQTVGWYSSSAGDEDYTITGVRLDVRPVRVAQPLYRSW